MNLQEMDYRQRMAYLSGLRAGRADRFLGSDPSMIALTADNLPGYSEGYRDGYYKREVIRER